MIIAGIDEAGKGPVIGPMVICGVSISEDFQVELNSWGLKDSKKLTRNKRDEFSVKILESSEVHVLKLFPEKLDELMSSKTLNQILVDCYSEIINVLKPDLTFVDSPDVKPERFKGNLQQITGRKVKAAHKADELFPIVSAASIVAKVERDREIEILKETLGEFGSGYCSDARTIQFLKDYFKKNRKYPTCVRKKWKTLERLQQQSLGDFF